MTIDPKTLPEGAVVEVSRPDIPEDWRVAYVGWGGPYTRRPGMGGKKRTGDVTRVFVPVPDGVAYDDALRAVEDARPWVRIDSIADLPDGTRLRNEFRVGLSTDTLYIHPDDVPDPDADLIEKVAQSLAERHALAPWAQLVEGARDKYRASARAALAVIREDQS